MKEIYIYEYLFNAYYVLSTGLRFLFKHKSKFPANSNNIKHVYEALLKNV